MLQPNELPSQGMKSVFTNTIYICSGCGNSLQVSAKHRRSTNLSGNEEFYSDSVTTDRKGPGFLKDMAQTLFLSQRDSYDQLQSEGTTGGQATYEVIVHFL